jgi:hypothetical protein
MPMSHRRDNIKSKLVEEALTLVCIPCWLNGVRTRYPRMANSCPVCSRASDKADTVVKVQKVYRGMG